MMIRGLLILALLGAAQPVVAETATSPEPTETSEARLALDAPAPATGIDRLQWTWLTAGLTVGAAVAATLVSVQALALEDDFRDETRRAREAEVSAATLTALGDNADNHALWASILWGVTGAAAVATGVLLYVEYFADDGTPLAVSVAPAPVRGGGVVSARVRF